MKNWKIVLPLTIASVVMNLPVTAQPPADDPENKVKAQAEKSPQAMNKKEMAEKLAQKPMVASEDELVAIKAPVASEDELVGVKSRVASEDELVAVKGKTKVKPDPVSEMAKDAIGAKARKVHQKAPHEATHIVQQGDGTPQKNRTAPFETEDIGIAPKPVPMNKGVVISEITKDGGDGKSSKR